MKENQRHILYARLTVPALLIFTALLHVFAFSPCCQLLVAFLFAIWQVLALAVDSGDAADGAQLAMVVVVVQLAMVASAVGVREWESVKTPRFV